MNAKIKEMPEYNVAYVRKMGAYGEETCKQAFAELVQWAEPKGYLRLGTILGLYWDNPETTPPEKCRTDACITVPDGTLAEGTIGVQLISGGQYAVCHFEITAEGFQQAWKDAFSWFIGKGYECAAKPCYELFHNNGEEDPDGRWIFDICIPLKKS
ncbi:AraC family transcriptional regulator [Desulfotalea psychrophila]|uniref:Related to DNA gyrase inhibitory protein n=1 Tax=Desulfotalea psychrophila (strain LSv54 / DSM 12343) TaxID=177439 RepID=Q6ALR9_DESPS|nr:GyrI-like domain-containing protein [Desulfotalea psychrophila]CAG36706.1 related to DNA gyrase inhibitory protein [Desulfotalea psychrophila LSv54]